MLNKDSIRELVYLVTVDDIKPIPGKDRVECAIVGGWTIMVRKDQFKPGDIGIYFEIDSKVPEKEPFMFLAQKHFKIKTQKYKTSEGHFWSQGLLMHPDDFGWETGVKENDEGNKRFCVYTPIGIHFTEGESRFLTAELGVVYAEAEDNKRKGQGSADPYKKMVQRYGKLFSHQPFRFLMKKKWGRKILFVFFGKGKNKKNTWPSYVKKTDEERVQNMPWILQDKEPWIVTEKIDGSSTTFTIKRGKGFKKDIFLVCSRNVVFDKPDKKCYYDTNIYTEMAEKYHMEEVLKSLLKELPNEEWITIQGETYGDGVQKNTYDLKGHDFAAFNLITSSKGRWNSYDMKELLNMHNVPCVPILKGDYILPDTIEEILNFATNKSIINNKLREGLVFRSLDGMKSFKAVSNEYLEKFHS